jgi:hypothetical protein
MTRSLCLHFCEDFDNTPCGSGSRHLVTLLIGNVLMGQWRYPLVTDKLSANRADSQKSLLTGAAPE